MKENQRIAVTKRMLKEGLIQLLRTKEMKKIRINELCEVSGVNRATFYRHYETPQDVLLELERDITLQMFPPSEPAKNISEAQARLERACSFIAENTQTVKILLRSNTELDMMRRVNEFYQDFLELRKTEKQYAELDPDTARSIVVFLGGGCYCLLREWVMEDIPKTPQQIASIICNLIRWPSPKDF